ncbi:ABC transporter permease [Kineosporia sp. J2-2]|uniref:Autoinducer 2 import system permease protein LsrC n=1 Tax=Kineosporia corallincola TaxID=2835133 RepID=A0ABS5TKQ3_9ACTN|nr:ABC transporter permease [Kineosporia corallincola]MBT0771595.1 ABC transporter permease [Kineosporia corallincola]
MTPTTDTHADEGTTLLVEPSALPARTRLIRSLLRSRELSVAIVLLLVIAAAALKSSDFVFSSDGWRDLLLTPSILLLLAAGQTVVIITRNVDLSVGAILGISAWLTGEVFTSHPGMPPLLAFAIGIAAGAGLGLVNGVVVAYGRVPAMVITLGTQYIFRGIVVTWAGSSLISASQMPDAFLDLGTRQILSIPVLFIVSIVIVAAVGYYLTTARSGRELYAVGSDPEAAVLYGLPVSRRVVTAFVLSGALAGLAGVVFAARYGTVNSGAGSGIEFQAVAAAVVGGVAISGGAGTVWGAAIGAGLLMTINSALPMVGISEFWQQALVGALIIAAIVLDRVLAARQARQLIEARDEA